MSIEETIAHAVRLAVRDEVERLVEQPKVQREALTVAETAEAVGMSQQWVRDAIRHHGLPARKAGSNGQLLVPLQALRRWLEDVPTPVASLTEVA